MSEIRIYDRVQIPQEPTKIGWVRQVDTLNGTAEVIVDKGIHYPVYPLALLHRVPIDPDVATGIAIWRKHVWDPSSRLCTCGEFFPALGEHNGHPEHVMTMILLAIGRS